MKPELHEICQAFQLSSSDQQNLEARWQELTEGWHEGILPGCLDLSAFRRLYPFCEGTAPLEKVLPLVEKIAALAWQDARLSLLAHICCRGAFELSPPFYFASMPDPIPLLGKKLSGMFSLLISLGAYPHMVSAYAKNGVPEKYAQDALKWFGGTMYIYGLAHENIPGRPFQFPWIRHYIDGELFRIGRLEYLMHPCPDWIPAIYRTRSGKLAVLARDGWRFRTAEDLSYGTESSVFISHLQENEQSITGTPIPPDGVMDFSKQVTLQKTEWNAAVSPWDLCPSIHIPGGRRMPWNDVRNSLLEARGFFSRYFHRRVPLFCCCSWILNPAWETELQNSNMANFRRQGYAFPCASWSDRCGAGFLFGRSDLPPDELPATNTAQKAMQRCYKAKRCGCGAVFFLADDLESLGNLFYRDNP